MENKKIFGIIVFFALAVLLIPMVFAVACPKVTVEKCINSWDVASPSPIAGCVVDCDEGLCCGADCWDPVICNHYTVYCGCQLCASCVGDVCQTNPCHETPVDNPCTTDSCDSTTGECIHTPKDCGKCASCVGGSCPPKDCKETPVDDPCTTDSCNSSTGVCIHDPKCPGKCQICVGGSCKDKCDDGKSCTTDSCNSTTGACSNIDNCGKCASCDATGSCKPTNKCDDDKLCTTDSCDSSTGACTNTPKECSGNPCNPGSCNPDTGSCVTTPYNCSTDPSIDPTCKDSAYCVVINKTAVCKAKTSTGEGGCCDGDIRCITKSEQKCCKRENNVAFGWIPTGECTIVKKYDDAYCGGCAGPDNNAAATNCIMQGQGKNHCAPTIQKLDPLDWSKFYCAACSDSKNYVIPKGQKNPNTGEVFPNDIPGNWDLGPNFQCEAGNRISGKATFLGWILNTKLTEYAFTAAPYLFPRGNGQSTESTNPPEGEGGVPPKPPPPGEW